jgi:hypothetical protein
MGIFYLKENDTRPAFEAVLYNPDDTPYDLTGATNIYLHILIQPSETAIEKAASATSSTGGVVGYTWTSGDWGTTGLVVGEHDICVEVVGPGTVRATFPNDGYDTLSVIPDIGDGA